MCGELGLLECYLDCLVYLAYAWKKRKRQRMEKKKEAEDGIAGGGGWRGTVGQSSEQQGRNTLKKHLVTSACKQQPQDV